MISISRCAVLIALTAAACGALWLAPRSASAQGTNVLIVLDSSGSMRGKVGGQVKMDLAEKVVADLVENMPADMNVGLLVYGARSPREQNNCDDIELIQPMGPPDAAKLGESLRGVQARGMTPIGGSLRRAAEVLRAHEMSGHEGASTIVLVSDGTESCHADPCQVAREVHEETGVRVVEATYHSSQPWPFPSSIMLGFFARAEPGELAIDPEEIEEARWFARAELRQAVERREVKLPAPLSIARRLVEDWLEG